MRTRVLSPPPVRRRSLARARAISSLSTAINRPRRDIFIYAPASNPPYTVRRLRFVSPFFLSLSLARSLFRRYVNRNRLSLGSYRALPLIKPPLPPRDACVDRCWERFESTKVHTAVTRSLSDVFLYFSNNTPLSTILPREFLP